MVFRSFQRSPVQSGLPNLAQAEESTYLFVWEDLLSEHPFSFIRHLVVVRFVAIIEAAS